MTCRERRFRQPLSQQFKRGLSLPYLLIGKVGSNRCLMNAAFEQNGVLFIAKTLCFDTIVESTPNLTPA